jgi:hypothetical protein
LPIEALPVSLGTRLPWFQLSDLTGTQHNSRTVDQDKPLLIMFLCDHSPYVRHIESTLAQLTDEWMDAGMLVLAIAPNDSMAYPDDAPKFLQAQIERAGFRFPYLLDVTQSATKAFRASCTPDFFLYGPDLRLIYHGQFDASRPANDVAVTGDSLRQAVEAVLSDALPPRLQHTSLGCSIKWKAGREPLYFVL